MLLDRFLNIYLELYIKKSVGYIIMLVFATLSDKCINCWLLAYSCKFRLNFYEFVSMFPLKVPHKVRGSCIHGCSIRLMRKLFV